MIDPAAAGWKTRTADGFSGLVGPIWAKREGEIWAYGFLAEPRHANPYGVVHGGMLVTLIDHALGAIVWEATGRQRCATIQLDTHFVAAARVGQFIEARGRVVRLTRSVAFMHGTVSTGANSVVEANGVWKLFGTEERE
jgi:uncharacterized protein (TIGR00369 family)